VKIIRRVALLIFGAAFLLYGGDFLLAEIQGNKGLGSVDVRIMWAIRQKNGRIDYELGDTETRPCVHTLFPHSGYAACWYLTRQKYLTITVGLIVGQASACGGLQPAIFECADGLKSVAGSSLPHVQSDASHRAFNIASTSSGRHVFDRKTRTSFPSGSIIAVTSS
jgi:hypothetical protein